MRSPETFRVQDAPLGPLLVKELWEILSGRALWTMLLLMCPLIGYSFFQAISLYGEASAAGLQSPVLAASLSPLDGVLVPTLGASYVAVTLVVTVHLAAEDPRYADLLRNVLAKLERVLPNVSVRLAGGRQTPATNSGDDSYGEVEYAYANRSDISRSTSPREILPLLYGLAGVSPPAPAPGSDYPGYPLIAGGRLALLWFFCGLPLCIAIAWWRSRRLPANHNKLTKEA